VIWEERSGDTPTQEDRRRAGFYALLSRLLAAPPPPDALAQVATLEGDDSLMGRSLTVVAQLAASVTPDEASFEYSKLFVGLTEGELRPYGSYYLTGFLYEKPLARLRSDLGALGIRASPENSEPEDHIAVLCEVMHGLIAGKFDVPAELDVQRHFFEAHLAPWAGYFFADLEVANAARLYRPVGALGRTFIDVERQAFSMIDDVGESCGTRRATGVPLATQASRS
jgi:TorA maturation chaperone TorD